MGWRMRGLDRMRGLGQMGRLGCALRSDAAGSFGLGSSPLDGVDGGDVVAPLRLAGSRALAARLGEDLCADLLLQLLNSTCVPRGFTV